MEEKILDFIMEYAQENENVPFQVIEETFNIQMDESLRSIIRDAIWDRDNVSDVVIENEGEVEHFKLFNTKRSKFSKGGSQHLD